MKWKKYELLIRERDAITLMLRESLKCLSALLMYMLMKSKLKNMRKDIGWNTEIYIMA